MKKSVLLVIFLAMQMQTFAQACTSNTLEIREVKPRDTDPNIAIELLSHQVYINPNCESNGKLLLHLVGTIDSPRSTTFYPSLAANNGFKAISLKYRNLDSATELCRTNSDVDCYTNFHEELIYGTDSSPDLEINESEGIYNRVLKLLIYLNEVLPDEGWGDFLSSETEIDWSNITISGHSQGGGHATFIAKNHEVERVIAFASPNEYSTFFNATAPWLSVPGETPDDRFYAFANVFDDVVDFDEQYSCWDALNMTNFGDSLSVDQKTCPFTNTKILYTRETMDEGLKPNHSLMIIDDFTPIENGVPKFLKVWEYLLNVCTISDLNDVHDVALKANVYPNPTSGQVTIESEEIIQAIEIFNVQGILLQKLNPNRNLVQLDLNANNRLLIFNVLSDSEKRKSFKLLVH